jgi:hypothetical protein
MNRANQSKSKLYDGKPVFAPILSGNGYFDQWQTFGTSTVGMLHRNAFTASPMDEFVERRVRASGEGGVRGLEAAHG